MAIEPGDKVTITVSGTLRPGGPTTASFRTETVDWLVDDFGYTGLPRHAEIVYGFGHDAKIKIEHEPQYKNGVHIDSDGRYWMKRPDGWHRMTVTRDRALVVKPTLPVERLVEAKDKRNA